MDKGWGQKEKKDLEDKIADARSRMTAKSGTDVSRAVDDYRVYKQMYARFGSKIGSKPKPTGKAGTKKKSKKKR